MSDLGYTADYYIRLLAEFDRLFKAAPSSSYQSPAASTAQPTNPISGGGGDSLKESQ